MRVGVSGVVIAATSNDGVSEKAECVDPTAHRGSMDGRWRNMCGGECVRVPEMPDDRCMGESGEIGDMQ